MAACNSLSLVFGFGMVVMVALLIQNTFSNIILKKYFE